MPTLPPHFHLAGYTKIQIKKIPCIDKTAQVRIYYDVRCYLLAIRNGWPHDRYKINGFFAC